MFVTEFGRCRVCGSKKPFESILNLGNQHIANAFHKKDESIDPPAPLHLMRCVDCDLVQLEHMIDTDSMYRTYWYQSGINKTMQDHLQNLVVSITRHIISLKPGDVWIDIGCNDGTLLSNIHPSIKRIGVDPSNIKLKEDSCDTFINDYFSYKKLKDHGKARVITSIAMFYDLNDPKEFVKDIRKCLRDDGLWVVELSYLSNMLGKTAYGTICHEHVCYYRVNTFERALEDTDLEIKNISFNDINGGSFRLFIAPKDGGIKRKKAAKKLTRFEYETYDINSNWKYNVIYKDFARNVAASKVALLGFLQQCKKDSKRVYGYGASTKGQVLMQYCGITPDLVTAIAERNPKKYDLYTPGTNVRICPEKEIRDNPPDYLIVFPWYFRNEFIEREEDLLKAGCKMVFPLPKFEIYGEK